MTTNEEAKRQHLKRAATAREQLLDQLEKGKEGDVQHREQRIVQSVMERGRHAIETLLARSAREDQPRVPGERLCGHPVRLVRERERHVVTLMGRRTIKRGSDHGEENTSQSEGTTPVPACPGSAPCDQHWGLTRSQASPGVPRLLATRSARRPMRKERRPSKICCRFGSLRGRWAR